MPDHRTPPAGASMARRGPLMVYLAALVALAGTPGGYGGSVPSRQRSAGWRACRLPGAHHDFDLYESIRSAAVNKAVEQFAARVSAFCYANHQDWQPAQNRQNTRRFPCPHQHQQPTRHPGGPGRSAGMS